MTKNLWKFLDRLMWQLVPLSGSLDAKLKVVTALGGKVSYDELEVICALRRMCSLIWNQPTGGNVDRMQYCIEAGGRVLNALEERKRQILAAERIKLALAPSRSKPAPVQHRSPNATNVGSTTKKGSNAEIPNIGGTSRDALRRRRRRERQSA